MKRKLYCKRIPKTILPEVNEYERAGITPALHKIVEFKKGVLTIMAKLSQKSLDCRAIKEKLEDHMFQFEELMAEVDAKFNYHWIDDALTAIHYSMCNLYDEIHEKEMGLD